MRYRGRDGTMHSAQRGYGLERCERRQTPARERDRMEDELLGRDRRRAVLDPCRDVNLEAGIARRARHRQPVRQKVPILGDDVEEPGWGYVRARIFIRGGGGAVGQSRLNLLSSDGSL